MLSAGPHEGADDLDLIGEHLGGEAGAERKTRKFGNAETRKGGKGGRGGAENAEIRKRGNQGAF